MSLFQPFHSSYMDVEPRDAMALVRIKKTRLTEEENIEQFGHELANLAEHYGYEKVVLNMEPVIYLTSSILGKIITLHRKMHRKQGQLILCQLTPEVRQVVEASGLKAYFNIEETEADAIAKFSEE